MGYFPSLQGRRRRHRGGKTQPGLQDGPFLEGKSDQVWEHRTLEILSALKGKKPLS